MTLETACSFEKKGDGFGRKALRVGEREPAGKAHMATHTQLAQWWRM
jgi:hypothetical protein